MGNASVLDNGAKKIPYSDMQDGWYSKSDHPLVFLRAEHELRNPWVIKNLSQERKILDIGCGAGMLANSLAKAGHFLTGIDISETSIDIARQHDETKSVRYLNANAYSLPFKDGEFDAVCLMDVLEQVEEPYLVVGEAARVLKPKGLLFFHTINRTLLSYFLIYRGIEHSSPYPLFIKPEELEDMFETHKMTIQSMTGIRPSLSRSFWKMLLTHRLPRDFSFQFSRSLKMGYCGFCRKKGMFSLH